MGRIFISYSRADKAFADQLRTDLEQYGADVWIDVEDIPAGLKWSSAVQQALDTCTIMVVILSPESAASQNVEDEWQYFLDQNKPLVPVLLRPTKPHFQISRIQYVDFSQQPYRAALCELCAELQGKGVQFSRPIPAPPRAERAAAKRPVAKQPAASPPVRPPQSFPYSAPANQARRHPRRSLLSRLMLAPFWLLGATIRAMLWLPLAVLRHSGRLMMVGALLVLVGMVIIALLLVWPGSNPEPEPMKDDPADVVRVYFEALESENMGWLDEILCPSVFHDEIRAEYEYLFEHKTYRVFELEIHQVEPLDELSVQVLFFFALGIEDASGDSREIPPRQARFRIERRYGQPDEIWCSTDFLLDDLH